MGAIRGDLEKPGAEARKGAASAKGVRRNTKGGLGAREGGLQSCQENRPELIWPQLVESIIKTARRKKMHIALFF